MERIPVQLPSVTLASVTQLVLIYPCVPAFLPWVVLLILGSVLLILRSVLLIFVAAPANFFY